MVGIWTFRNPPNSYWCINIYAPSFPSFSSSTDYFFPLATKPGTWLSITQNTALLISAPLTSRAFSELNCLLTECFTQYSNYVNLFGRLMGNYASFCPSCSPLNPHPLTVYSSVNTVVFVAFYYHSFPKQMPSIYCGSKWWGGQVPWHSALSGNWACSEECSSKTSAQALDPSSLKSAFPSCLCTYLEKFYFNS